MKIVKGFLLLCLTAPLWAAEAPWVQCQRERYYEGEKVSCTVRQDLMGPLMPHVASLRWSLLGKDLKTEAKILSWPYKEIPSVEWKAPEGLKAVTPLRLDVIFTRLNSNEALAFSHAEVQLFPRDPTYWMNSKEFIGKRIAVYDPQGGYAQELTTLGLPFERLQELPDMESRECALLIVGPVDRKDENFNRAFGFLPRLVRNGWNILFLEQTTFIHEPSTFSADPFSFISIHSTDNALTWNSTCPTLGLPAEIHAPHLWGRGKELAAGVASVAKELSPELLWGYGACAEGGLHDRGVALMFKEKRGRYTVSQLNLAEHFKDEPLARWALAQLLRRALAGDNGAKE